MMFEGQPLGRDILGNAERLRQYTTVDALRFARNYYRPTNAVFYVYGDVPFAQVVRVLERLLPVADFVQRPAFVAPPIATPCAKNIRNERVVEKVRIRRMCWWEVLRLLALITDVLPWCY